MFRRPYSSCLILILGAVLLTPHTVAETGKKSLFPIYVDSKAGFIDQTGRVVIQPQFDEVLDFSEGLAAVKIGNNWGYIDDLGTVVVPTRFVYAEPFSEGMACILKGGYGFINRQGSFVIPLQSGWAYSFSEGLARAGVPRKTKPNPIVWEEARFPESWLFIDHGGKIVLRPKYDYVDDFHGGFALVANRGKDGFLVNYIDKAGKLAFVDWFVAGRKFSEGLAVVSNDPNGYTGEHFGSLIYDNYSVDDSFPLSGGIKPIDFLLVDSGANKTPVGRFEEISNFSEGLAAVRFHGKWGFIDKWGQIVIAPKFDTAGDFSEGLSGVAERGKVSYINPSGRVVLSLDYEVGEPFKNGLAKVWESGKTGYIDKSGHIVWKPTR